MKTVWTIVKGILIGWGLFCAVGALCLVGLISWTLLRAPSESLDVTSSACERKARGALNWCRLDAGRMEKVLHAYNSKRSFTGDHTDLYAIKVSRLEASELTADAWGHGWTRCDQAEGVLKDAIEFASGWSGWAKNEKITWFPKGEELKSSDMFVYAWRIVCHGTRPTAIQLMFARPSDKTVFYISVKT